MKGHPVKYQYDTSLQWTEQKKGVLHCKGKPDLAVACPPEFGGHPGIWSPEDMFVGSFEVCILTTFLWFVNKEKLTLKSYESTATGVVELVGNTFVFSSVLVKIKIGVSSDEERKAVEKIIQKVPRACLVSKSTNVKVDLQTDIFVAK